ncbi:MAG: hypothetical protein K8T90_06090 [Planctomycetes bacterium]|nr:hypothetical protein [Planctomycetota bacterium]
MPVSRFVPANAVALSVAALTAVALNTFVSAPALADRVDAFVAPNTTATVTVASPGDVATAAFLVQSGPGKKIAITVKPAAKSTLALDVRLVAPDGTTVDASSQGGTVKATTKLVTISLPNAPQAGLWRVEVRGAESTAGASSVTVKLKDTTVVASNTRTIPAGGALSFPIDVGSNQALSLTLKRGKGSPVTPKVKILDPNGAPLADDAFIGAASSKTGALSIKSFRMPVFGRYTILLTGEAGGGGGVVIAAKTAAAKAVKGAPVANPGAPTDAEPAATKTLDGTGSQATGGTPKFVWTQVAGPTVVLTGASTSTPSFVAPVAGGSLGFEMAVAVNGIWSQPRAVTVETGTRPIADAGRSQTVATAAAVTLDGTGSLVRRATALGYAWRQDPNDAVQVSLTGATTSAPTFNSPAAPAVLHFGLTVDDGALSSTEDYVTIRVGTPENATPDAGRVQVVPRMATVHLSALATRTPSGSLDVPLQWTQTAGPAVTLDNANSPYPAFTAPKTHADLAFQLTAGGATDYVSVHVRAGEDDLAPVAKGNGTQFIASGNAALNATTSFDPDADTLTTRWAQIEGAALAPTSATAASTTVSIPAGNASRAYAVQVNDGLAYSPPDIVAVRNTGYSGKPVAAAGNDITVQSGAAVNLDGRGSARTQGAGAITYVWRQVSAKDWFNVTTRVPAFNTTAANPSFTLPPEVASLVGRRTMVFELIVNDGAQDSAPDLVTVTFLGLPINGKPTVVATASTNSPLPGTVVTLQAVANDGDGDPVTVKWTQTSGAAVTLTGGNRILSPSFTAPASGTLVFSCVANDGFEDGPAGVTTVSVDAAPIARVVATPTGGLPNTAATIDASTSSDAEGHALTYTWSQTTGPAVSTMPTNTSTAVWSWTTLQAPATTATFRLVVNDGRQNSAPATVTFNVGAPITAAPAASVPNAPYGATVNLAANVTSGGSVTYAWTQLTTGGNANDPVVTLTGATTQAPSFVVPSPTSAAGFGATPSATFRLIASNGTNSDTKTVQVTFYASFDNGNSAATTTKTVYSGIIAANCMGGSCHSGTAATKCSTAVGYSMGSASAFHSNSVNKTSCVGTNLRVDTSLGASSSSVIDRLKGIGALMPKGGSALSGADIGLITDWINQGASSTN